jgi:hypothetical protein
MWDWLDDVVDWGSEAVDTVGDWIGGGDAADLADTSDYWSSNTGFSGYGGLGGLFTGDNLIRAGKGLYEGYQTGEANKAYLAQQQPLQDYYASVLPQLQSYYDPANSRKGIRSEFERRQGLLTPYWDETDAKRKASAAQAGRLGSSTYGKQQAQAEAQRANLLSNQVLPAAESAYYNAPTQMMSQFGNVAGLMSGQPNVQPAYQKAQQSPWETYFDSMIAKSL